MSQAPGWKARAAQWFREGFVPVPAYRWEWFFMRLFFAVVVVREFLKDHPYQDTDQKGPNGIAQFFDLTWLHAGWDFETRLGNGWFFHAFLAIAVVCMLCYVAGKGLPVVLPIVALLHTLIRTYANSQGGIGHSHQIVTLGLLAQVGVAWWVWGWQRWHKKPYPFRPGIDIRGYYIYYTQAVVAATYVVAGLSKLFNSMGLWVWNAPYLSYDLVKSQRQEYYELLNPAYAGNPFYAFWVVEHPMLSRMMAGGAFFLELFALLALKNRPWALAIGLGMIVLHRSIYAVMHLEFANNEALLAIFLVNVPYWLWWTWQKVVARRKELPLPN